MKIKIDRKTLLLLVSFSLVLLNYLFFPNYIAAQIISVFMIVAAYIISGNDLRKFIYFNILLFAIQDSVFILPVTSRYSLYYFHIMLFIYMISVIFGIFRTNKLKGFMSKLVSSKYTIFITIFIVYAVLSVFLAYSKRDAVFSIFIYFVMISFLFMNIIENRTTEDLKSTFNFLGFAYFIILIIGLLEIMGIRFGFKNHYVDLNFDIINHIYLKRIPTVFFYNPNNYAVILVVGMIFTSVLYQYESTRLRRFFYIILFGLSQINLIFSTSRTAWITALGGLLFAVLLSYVVRRKDLRRTSVRFLIATSLIFVVFSALPISSMYYGKFNSTPILRKLNIFNIKNMDNKAISISIGGSGSESERATLLYDVIHGVFLEKNILGFGAGNTGNYLRKMNNTFGVFNVHSFWFEILGDFGVFIFLYTITIYTLMMYDLFKNYKRNGSGVDKEKYSLMMLIASVALVLLAFAPSSVTAFVPFWLILGIIASRVIFTD